MSDSAPLVVGILLAAGAGSRFGGEKLLHPLEDGVAIAAHAARRLIAVAPDVVAVVRWGDFPLYEMLEQEGCQVTMFQGATRGMGASLAHAIRQARAADIWVVALADMPRIASSTIAAVIAALGQSDGAIAAPVYQGRRGHPVAFRSSLREELLALDGDEGARALIDRHRDRLRLVECDDSGILYDIDRKGDLAGAA